MVRWLTSLQPTLLPCPLKVPLLLRVPAQPASQVLRPPEQPPVRLQAQTRVHGALSP
jgi:hypothetical protein